MQKLDETSIALFKDSPSKRFLIDVINSLADHGHVSIEAINKKDEEHSLVWNWLNKAASTFSINRIIQVFKVLGIQTVFIPSIGDIEIWYRSTQGVFCKSRAGYREILSVEKLTEYLQKLTQR